MKQHNKTFNDKAYIKYNLRNNNGQLSLQVTFEIEQSSVLYI